MPPHQTAPMFDLSKLSNTTFATEHVPMTKGNAAKDCLIAFDWSVAGNGSRGSKRQQ